MKKTVFSFIIALLCVTACTDDDRKTDDVQQDIVLNIHPEKISSGYLGNGLQLTLYESNANAQSDWGKAFNLYMDQRMWDKTFQRLDYFRPRLARIMISSKSLSFQGNDGNGNPIINMEHNIDLVDRMLNYCDRNSITVLWGEWGTGTISEIRNPVWARTVIDYADYLINVRNHASVKYFIGVNEPDGNWTDATLGSFEPWRIATGNVYQSILDKGIGDRLQIAGPDACPGITGTGFIEQTAALLRDKIGIWNIHIYPYPDQIRNGSYEGLIRNWHGIMGRQKKLVLGEVGMKYKQGTTEYTDNIYRATNDPMGRAEIGSSNMFVYDYFYAIDIADLYIQSMRGGASGGCAWICCDAMVVGQGGKLKRWGMWNIFGTKMGNAADENIRPWFYTMSLLSRYIPQGSDILTVDASGTEGVRAIAATDGGEMTVAIVNNSKTARKVTFKKDGEAPHQMKKYVCFENDRPTDANQFPVPKETKTVDLSAGESVDLPPLSFVLFTSMDF
jgi:hypothetical protein